MTAPLIAGGSFPPSTWSGVWRSARIWACRSFWTACCSPVSMLSTTVSPICGAVELNVPTTSPPAFTERAWRPATPFRYGSYWASIPETPI